MSTFRYAKRRVGDWENEELTLRRYNDDDTFAKCRACGLIFDIGEVGTHAFSCKASKSEKKRVFGLCKKF